MVKESGSFERRNAEFLLESIIREFTSFRILRNCLGKLCDTIDVFFGQRYRHLFNKGVVQAFGGLFREGV